MQVTLASNRLVLIPENDADRAALSSWGEAHRQHVFAATENGEAQVFNDLGPREEACREPVPVCSMTADVAMRIIGNFAPTPFTMDGREYACVEGFWQGLKFEPESQRRRVAMLSGPEARQAGQEKGYGERFVYEGQTMVPGTWDHWALMERACRAKFSQNAEAAAALLSTGNRPLEHRMRRDSRTIPGVIMAEIWMRIRRDLGNGKLVIQRQR